MRRDSATWGILYETGRGVPQSWEMAVKWYRAARCRASPGTVQPGLVL